MKKLGEDAITRDLVKKTKKNESDEYDDEELDKLLRRIEKRRTLTS